MKKSIHGLGLCLALTMPGAHAASQEIRALFQPDPTQPGKNVFINKTPNSGYCGHYPSECFDNGMFSIQLPVRLESTRPLLPGVGIAMKMPSNWRRLTVTNADTQESETVEVRITGFGSQFVLSDSAANLVGVQDPLEGHQKLWNSSSWVNAAAPCLYSGMGWYGDSYYRFFWKTPVEATCTKVAAYTIPSMYFDTVDFAYELRTPNPLGMSTGLYTGSLSYTIGPGGDFSFGPLFVPDDGSLTLDFVLDVQHTLKVDIPPGGNNVTLEPEGGWAPWLESGRKPTRLFRDQPFFISASSRFKVMLLCNSYGGNKCNLGSPKGDTTSVAVSMTLPTSITHGNGSTANRLPLRFNDWVGPFQPSLYVDRKEGSLNFEISKWDIDFLLRPGKTDRLRGNVTIIWDSDV